MIVAFATVPNDPRWLQSLYDWLNADAELGPDIELRLHAADPEPDAQGSMFDVVNALVNDSFGLAGLALSFSNWHGAHRERERPAIIVERGGVKVTIPATTEVTEETIRLITELAAIPEADDSEPEASG